MGNQYSPLSSGSALILALSLPPAHLQHDTLYALDQALTSILGAEIF